MMKVKNILHGLFHSRFLSHLSVINPWFSLPPDDSSGPSAVIAEHEANDRP